MPPPLPFCESLFVTALSLSANVAPAATCTAPPLGLLPPTPLPFVRVTPDTPTVIGVVGEGGKRWRTRLALLPLMNVWRAPAPMIVTLTLISSTPPAR